jgi:hypothetical protein
MSFLNKLRIPTLLGLTLILAGVGVGTFLVTQPQTIVSKASADLNPKDIKITNIGVDSATITWSTDTQSTTIINYGPGNFDQTAIDDRDQTPSARKLHFITVKNLQPNTSYNFKILSGKQSGESHTFQTKQEEISSGLRPIIGSVLDGDKFLISGIAYLEVPGQETQAALIKSFGTFLIPISQLNKEGVDTTATLTILTDNGTKAVATFNILSQLAIDKPIGPLRIGQTIDLTNQQNTLGVSTAPQTESKYDLNHDGKVNSQDYALAVKRKLAKKEISEILDQIQKQNQPTGKAVNQ